MSDLPLWRRVAAIVAAVVLVTILVLAVVPTGKIAVLPQSPVGLEGRVDIDQHPANKVQGRWAFVGVDQQSVRLLHKWWIQLRDDDVSFAPEPDQDASSRDANATDDPSDSNAMTLAKRVASGIAFDLAGDPVDWSGTNATITSVTTGSPAAVAGLRGGDSVIKVDGTEVDNSVDAGKLMYKHPPGSTVVLNIRRNGLDRDYTVGPTVAPPADDPVHKSLIGVSLDTIGLQVNLPQPVSIDSGGFVGTSGGLAFALFVFDSVSDRDLAEGRSIVATGALTVDGLVQSVQRVRQKAIATQRAGADLLLVPRANLADAVSGVKAACGSDVRCVHVVPVTSVANAVDLLENATKLKAAEQVLDNG